MATSTMSSSQMTTGRRCDFELGVGGPRCHKQGLVVKGNEASACLSLCSCHLRLTLMKRDRQSRKRRAQTQLEARLDELAHHDNVDVKEANLDVDNKGFVDRPVVVQRIHQQTDNLLNELQLKQPSLCGRALDAESDEDDDNEEDEEEIDPVGDKKRIKEDNDDNDLRRQHMDVEQFFKDDPDSDAESADSDSDEPLKRAGSYTSEEVVRVMREKLIRLQKLYIDQLSRLQYLLREERRKYRVNLRREKEDRFMSIHAQPKDTIKEQEAYEQLKSLAHYMKPVGTESLLQAKLYERRAKATDPTNFRAPSYPKCCFNVTTSTKCGARAIPLAKHCSKHILEDNNQLLYRACGSQPSADELPCDTPVLDVFPGNTCVYHMMTLRDSVHDEREHDRVHRRLQEETSALAEAASATMKDSQSSTEVTLLPPPEPSLDLPPSTVKTEEEPKKEEETVLADDKDVSARKSSVESAAL